MKNLIFTDYITYCVGLSLTFLASLNGLDLINLSNVYYACLGLSGFIFAFIDFYKCNKRYKPKVVTTLYILAVLSIMVLPQLKYFQELNDNILNKLSQNATLFALGLVIIVISYKNKDELVDSIKKSIGAYDVMDQAYGELKQSYEDVVNINNELRKEIEEIKKRLKQNET